MPSSERDFHILWLMKEGHTPTDIASMLGYTARWVRTIVQRWNKEGPRRVRARKGTRVRAVVRPRYHWMYLYGFVQPQSGKTSWVLMPTVNTQALALALSVFAGEQGVGPNKHLLLVVDQAGWHTSVQLQLPEGLHLLFLPSHSPELQQASRLWPLCNEPLVNRVFNSLDELEQVQAERCRWLQAHPEVIRGRTSFHWWPASLDTT